MLGTVIARLSFRLPASEKQMAQPNVHCVPTQSSASSNPEGCQKVAGGKAAGRHPRIARADWFDPGGVAESPDTFIFWHPCQGANSSSEKTGGLCFAPTTGYFLASLQDAGHRAK